jgi:hypothetical protein
VDLTNKDRKRLRDMLTATRADGEVVLALNDSAESLNRLERAAGLQ